MAICMDVVGFLPGPSKSAAADVLESSAFAYAVGNAVAVCEVHRLHIAAMLLGGHRAPITAVKWCPAYHSRQFNDTSQLRLASGDSESCVVVWDVHSGSQAARLEDVPGARPLLRDGAARSSSDGSGAVAGGGGTGSGVTALGWVMPGRAVLAVVVAPALLLLWDVNASSILWKHELGVGSEVFSQLAVDPLNSRQLCLCGSSGAVAVLHLTDPADGWVDFKQYRVNLQQAGADTGGPKSPTPGSSSSNTSSSSSSSLQALFPVARGLLVLLLPRELVLFDLELGAPAASTALPSGQPAFSALLGVFGSGVCQGGGDDGGVDFLYCAHTDGGLSVWVRVPGELRFKLGCMSRLTPPPLRGASSQVTLCVVKATLWWKQQNPRSSSSHHAAVAVTAQTATSTARITAQLSSSLGLGGPTGREGGSRKAGREGPGSSTGAGSSGGSSDSSHATTLSGRCLLVMATTSDGRVWQWEVPLPRYPRRVFLTDCAHQPIAAITGSIQAARPAATPSAVLPQLVGLLQNLPGGITTIALQPWPLLTPTSLNTFLQHASTSTSTTARSSHAGIGNPAAEAGKATGSTPGQQSAAADAAASVLGAAVECVSVGVGATSSGHLAVFSVRRGLINPLAPEVVSSLSVHRDAVKGLRWLGPLPFLVSFSSEKGSGGGWRNTCILTDVRTGRSLPFRDGTGSEPSPLVGLRVSPSGSYILLLFKGSPAELWTALQPPAASARSAGGAPTTPTAAANTAAGSAPAAADGSQSRSQRSSIDAAADVGGSVDGTAAGAEAAAAAAAAARVAAAGSGGQSAGAGPGAAGPRSAGLVKPWRVRLVDLPFTAVEWVVTEEDMHKDEFNYWGPPPAEPDDSSAADGPAGRAAAAAAGGGGGDDGHTYKSTGGASDASLVDSQLSQSSTGMTSHLAAPSMSAAASDDETFPLEMLAFSLSDGRSGVLSFRGRKVHDVNPTRPKSGVGPHSLNAVAAVAAVWPLMLLGDADGQLLAWDLTHGRCTNVTTGLGCVRRIQLAPASPPVLSGATEAALSGAATARGSGVERMRAAVLFSSGQINVYDLDAAGRIRPGGVVSSAAASRLGVIKDIAWLPLPSPAGLGSILCTAHEDGSLSLMDVSQPLSVRPSSKARQALLHEVLSTPSPPAMPAGVLRPGCDAAAAAVVGCGRLSKLPLVLLPPGPLGSSMLLKQPWVLLLRFLLQAGIPQDTLLYISSSNSTDDDDDEVQHELQQLLPRSARAILSHLAAGDQELTRLQQSFTSGGSATPTGTGPDPQQALQRLLDVSLSRSATMDVAAAATAADIAAASSLVKGQTGSLPSAALLASKRRGGSWRQLAGGNSSRTVVQQLSAGVPGRHLWDVPDQSFNGDLLQLLRQIAKLRGSRQLLLPDEWCAYTEALKSGQLSRRMAIAAHLSGHTDEASFWSALPATLASIKAVQTAIEHHQQQQQQQVAQQQRGGQHTAATAASVSQPATPAAMRAAPAAAAAAAAAAVAGPLLSNANEAATPPGTPQCDPSDVVPDYDTLVQRALEGSLGVQQPAAGAAGGPNRPQASRSSSGLTAAASGAAVDGASSPLARRGSGAAAVPGRVLVRGGSEPFSSQGVIKLAASGRPVRLWDEEVVLADAQERLLWHESLPGQLFEGEEGLLEGRLLEYCVLGDFATAVAFLLSTPPENTVRYYRSMVSALALAATASLRAQGTSNTASSTNVQAAAMLHLQAAKVVSAHASSIGDGLLGVPLNCSAGLNADAVSLLQDAGMWQLAASLIARTLSGAERAQALSRWAGFVQQQEGSVWRCVGILTTAGCLQAAAQVLHNAGLPDCAQAYVQACQQAGLLIPSPTLPQNQQQETQQSRLSADNEEDDIITVQRQQQRQELFDLLALRARMLPRSSSRLSPNNASSGEAVSGPQLLQAIASDYSGYVCTLVSSL